MTKGIITPVCIMYCYRQLFHYLGRWDYCVFTWDGECEGCQTGATYVLEVYGYWEE